MRTETVRIVTKKLLQDIIPRFGLHLALGSNKALDFLVKCLKIQQRYMNWKLVSSWGGTLRMVTDGQMDYHFDLRPP